MFIDEGFGALDGERRDALLQVLEQLGSENDTQLGIISHVSEIKDQMDVSIEIEKINEQSRFADESAAN
jgi:DNA repair exonuclease SbcCD ATPase subunit